jgi:hypothetical protein
MLTATPRRCPTWQDLVRLSDEQLGAIDIALVNLACAIDLPGPIEPDVDLCLLRLDEWAQLAKEETERGLERFRQKPEAYQHSEAYFRVLSMVTTLWKQCGVRYNEAKVPEHVPLDTEDSFLHGVIQGQGGTCASLPVAYAAVGRRLGYPIKLVTTRTATYGHLFCRWEAQGERFNIDVNQTGLSCDPDEHYRTGLFALTPEGERFGYFLRSQSPREELAGFLAQRAFRWKELGRYRQAANGFAWALALQPGNGLYHDNAVHVCKERWGPSLLALEPPGFPHLEFVYPLRRFPPPFPEQLERAILGLEGWENLLKDPEHERQLWGPMRRGVRPLARPPAKASILFRPDGCCNINFYYTKAY